MCFWGRYWELEKKDNQAIFNEDDYMHSLNKQDSNKYQNAE